MTSTDKIKALLRESTKKTSYIVIELNALRNDWIRHNATFMQQVNATTPQKAIEQVRDLNQYEMTLGDLIVIPESRFTIYSEYGGGIRKWDENL